MGRSPGEGKGYPHLYSGLENSKDCIVHEVTESQTRLSDFHYGFGGKTMPEEKGTTEDEMAGWHHGPDGHESE